MVLQGWISLHRKILNHELFLEKRTFSKFEAWIDLLLMVNHEDKKVLLGNDLIPVKRGQRITSIRQLCDRWRWSNSKVTQFLKLLETEGMVVVKSDTKKTVISIVKYDFYQSSTHEKTTENRRENDTNQTRKHTNNNDNNDNNENLSSQHDQNPASNPKRKERVYDEESSFYKMAEYLREKILSWKPNAKVPADLNNWSDEFRKLVEIDNRSKSDIHRVIDFATSDSFWQVNILSAKKLREKFDTLDAKSSTRSTPMTYQDDYPDRDPFLEKHKKMIQEARDSNDIQN